jgi:dTDP-4-dehydrorhamnose reductase
MRLLILGGAGMLGHKLWQVCRSRFDTWVTLRGLRSAYVPLGLFEPERVVAGVDAFNFDTLVSAMAQVRPEVVVNCIGIIKQVASASDPIASLTINALLPHRLAVLARSSGARLIHISTDCVFAGRKGGYTEADHSDAEDLYGRTKFLGEVTGPGALTLRTSIIGRELATTSGLVEWFLSQPGGRVQGHLFRPDHPGTRGPDRARHRTGAAFAGALSCLGGADRQVLPAGIAARGLRGARRD